ncbi:Sodium-dependent dicarboxylate transporter SdcS [Corynebacterium faecale]|uniref:SLC13 family permease n=1 Tax=Corynebacterium faecale TaxID=1758466 RepID=UPI0025B2FBD9|nr:SLC13 family permease [Corynebacterium faecale]WJY91676.1 Sodium-dependent dicarboxylate transporter SdcS [Corynebacterium faecale]
MTQTVPGSQTSNSAPSTRDRDYSPGQLDRGIPQGSRNYKFAGMAIGVTLAGVVALIIPNDVSHDIRVTAAIAVLMGALWITEAVPLAATAMLPLILFPAFGVVDLGSISGNYSSGIILLFLGGFLLALALQRWNLHKRIAINIVLRIGTAPARLVAGFMIATALLSMWVSNTATAMMMIPMGMTVVKMLEEKGVLPNKSKLGTGLVIGIAYSATIGGFGTMIGSPVNLVILSYIRGPLDYSVSFLQWMSVGIPTVIVFTFIGWVLLTKVLWRSEVDEIPGGREIFENELTRLGKMGGGERIVSVIFALTAMGWIFVPLIFGDDIWLSDTVIALIAGVAVMTIPANPRTGVMILNWKDTREMPWDVLILIAGGLALSSQITQSGLSEWLAGSLTVLGNAPEWLMVLAIVLLLLAVTELTSSTATSAAFVPVIGGLAIALGMNPVIMAMAAGLACTCSFMMPVGTPPNAIAYSTGAVSMNQLMRTGIWMNAISVILVTIIALTLVPMVFG